MVVEGVTTIMGSECHADPCMDIARDLRDFFDDGAMERMPIDLREHLLLVAEDGENEVVGFISVLLRNSDVAEISWMAVRRERWRQGIGQALLVESSRVLEERGTSLLFVKTLADTVDYEPYEGTRTFYASMGFHLLDVIDPYPGWAPGNPCAIYVKAL